MGGTLRAGFLYKDALDVVAQLDGSGNVVARFVFGAKPNVPDYFTSSAGTFRILSDHLGSPRLIVNVSTGAVAERLDYDEFGTNAYDALEYLSSMTDPLSHSVVFENDAIGRPVGTVLADGRTLTTGYDPDSNPTLLTLPTTQAHGFAYTPVDLLSTYTPPSLGSGTSATQYSYDFDRRATSTTRPDGIVITYGYDAAGRLLGTGYPQGTQSRTYSPTTGQLATISAPGGETLSYAYDGFLRTAFAWSGPVVGSVTFGFDSNFRIVSQGVNGQAVALGYDVDSLLTQAGAMAVSRDTQNGRVTGTTLGSVTDVYTYDADGLVSSYVANFSGAAIYSEAFLRDPLGRITQKTEAIGSETHVWVYAYDANGRLTDVTEDGSAVSHYGYDADDNRITFIGASGTVNATYDAQDRLVTYGGATYTYTANGELTGKTANGQATSYTYDALGNLLHVGLPSGTAIDYVVDGEERRVGKEVGGTLQAGFLYQDALNVVAQLDGSGNVVARFVFGTKPNVPDYFTSSAGTFRILSDHLGSPRLIVNTSTGAVAERIDYDEFGNVTQDTSPGLTPFGFAGGLYDKDTGLVRFGARDYDASVGRWTRKDPIRFGGGSFNLYGYVLNDPFNRVDPSGDDISDCLNAVWQVARACATGSHDSCQQALQSAGDACGLGGGGGGDGVGNGGGGDGGPPNPCPTDSSQGNTTCTDRVGSSGCTGNKKTGLRKSCTYACADGSQCTAYVSCKWRGDDPPCPASCSK